MNPISTSQLPEYLKQYDSTIQRQATYVYTSVYEKLYSETKNREESRKRAMKAMHSVLKKRFKTKDCMMKNSRKDYFLHLTDRWLNNLEG
jgi:hypothetical protein